MIESKLFYGVVENVLDPLKIGRVQVRVHGAHDPSPQKLPVDFLPWAAVMLPATSGTDINGSGRSPTGLLVGTEVMGITLDSSYTDLRVLFTWNGLKGETPEMNPMGIGTASALADKIETDRLKDIKVSKSNTVEELASERAVVYPLNDVETSRSGFVKESDSSNGSSRVTEIHPTGNYKEWRTDGSIQERVKSFIKIAIETSYHVFNKSWFAVVINNMVQKIGEDFYRDVTGQSTEVSARVLLKVKEALEIDTPEIRANGDMRLAGTLYVNAIRVNDLKADDISSLGVIKGTVQFAQGAIIAGSVSTVTPTPAQGAGDVSVSMSFEDNGGDY